MPKLHLKRTPAEEIEHAQRKARKAARKEAKRRHRLGVEETSDNADEHRAKRHNSGRHNYSTNWHVDEELDNKNDDFQRREENERFQQRMWDELCEQERLDNLETNFNSYSHIPYRWRSSAPEEPVLKADPQLMEEEEYAEWIRDGMWRKQHSELYQEQKRQKAAEAARKARERELAANTARLEAIAAEEKRRRKQERERVYKIDAKQCYETQWKALLAGEAEENSLSFRDVPWPCFQAYCRTSSSLSIDDLTEGSVSAFLLDFDSECETQSEKMKKDKVRETLLRFHPDKFEGRVMSRIKAVDRGKVQEAVGVVVRILNELSKNPPT